MSLKIMFADNDFLMRQKLKNLLGETGLHHDIIGEYSDGEGLITDLKIMTPDLIFLDVEMDRLGGIATTKQIKSKHPEIPIIIISNFDNFDYVKACYETGAVCYLLKYSLSAKELKNTIEKYNTCVKNDGKEDTEKPQAEPGMFEKIMTCESCDEVSRLMPIVPGILTYHRQDGDNLSLSQIYSTVDFILQENLVKTGLGLYKNMYGSRYYILLHCKDTLSEARFLEIENRCKLSIVKQIETLLNIKATLLYLPKCGSANETVNAFTKGEQKLAKNRHLERQAEKEEEDSRVQNNVFFSLSEQITTDIDTAIKKHDEQLCYKLVDKFFDRMHLSKLNYSYCQMLLSDLVLLIHRYDDGNDYSAILQDIQNMKRLDDIKVQLPKMLKQMFTCESFLFSSSNRYDLALSYIKEHFSENISLADVAQSIALSPTYLSASIKKHTGKSFSEWLGETRLENAQRLLRETTLPITEIAFRCGYQSYSYFISQFTKHAGISPRKYRLNCM